MDRIERLFELYKQVLLAHIQTKTVEPLFHEKSEAFYELLFDVFHTISEKRQDNETDEPGDCDILIQETYDNIEEARKIVEEMVKENNSIGMDNLLRGLSDKLEFACGNARAFIEEEKEEEPKNESEPMDKPINKNRIPKPY